jgi:hypothetical protein
MPLPCFEYDEQAMTKKMKQKKKPPGPPKPKATAALIEQRVAALFDLMMAGAERPDMCQFVSTKEGVGEHPWKMDADGKPLSVRQIDRYIQEACERVTAILETRTVKTLHLAELRVTRLYAHEMDDKNWQGALAKLQELHRLQDLYPSVRTKTELTGKDGGKIEAETTVIDTRKKILSFVDEFRAAAERNLMEAAEQNGHTNGDGSAA